MRAVRAAFAAQQSVTGEIGDRWSGGQLVLRPGKAGTREKLVPIESFFRETTFNVFFTDPAERFVGTSRRDDD